MKRILQKKNKINKLELLRMKTYSWLMVVIASLSFAQANGINNKFTLGVKFGLSNSTVMYDDVILKPYHKYIPHFEPIINYSFSKWVSSGFSMFYSQPVISFFDTKSIVSTVSFINAKLYVSPQLKISDLTIMLDVGPILGLNLKDDYVSYPDQFKKWFCFGFAGGMNFNYRVRQFEPIIAFDTYKYLTPFYESKNTGDYENVKHYANGYTISFGLRYYK